MNERALGQPSWLLGPPMWGLGVMLLLAGCHPKTPAHGTEFVVEIVGMEMSSGDSVGVAQQAVRARLEGLHVDAVVESDDAGRLVIRVPEVDPELLPFLRNAITARGQLEFRRAAAVIANRDAIESEPPVGCEMMEHRGFSHGHPFMEQLWVDRRPELNGGDIGRASVYRNSNGSESVRIEFTLDGKERFARLTTDMVNSSFATSQRPRLAIVLDGRVQSAPFVAEPIVGGTATISATFTDQEANMLACVLNHPFAMSLRLVDERTF